MTNKVLVPPIKCQGIKTKLVPLILRHAGKISNGRWVEPFMGSGVVGLNARCENSFFADKNPHLISFYSALKDQTIDATIAKRFLETEGEKLLEQGEEHYYFIRERFNENGNPLDFLFLTRACFNGMMRFNSKGKFNVPFCRRPERFAKAYITKIVNQIAQFQEALKHYQWNFLHQDVETTIAQATADEIQTLFNELSQGKEARYNNIVGFMLKVYTSADSMIIKRTKVGDGRKNQGPTQCNQPGLILFGTTIPEVFLQALSPTLMHSGLGSRCLFIEGDKREHHNHDADDFRNVPKNMIETARWWTEYLPPDPATGKVGNLSHENPTPRIVPMTHEAKDILNALGEKADNSYDKTHDPIERVLWTRVYENAAKLALIYAASEHKENPIIDANAARWASEFTLWVFQRMMTMVKQNVADSSFAKLCLRAENLIRKRGGTMQHRDLSNVIREVKGRDLDDVINKLIDTETIEKYELPSDRPGPKPICYRLLNK